MVPLMALLADKRNDIDSTPTINRFDDSVFLMSMIISFSLSDNARRIAL
ncbi:hypothetical protein [Bifidobacterium sp. ESL0790]|nr:hypothetical protein [Bifidobacterium sp. ESL0790]WEV73273.1 hypothetical protein OZY47_02570 [Bifidobacterium sp. ESL0790]